MTERQPKRPLDNAPEVAAMLSAHDNTTTEEPHMDGIESTPDVPSPTAQQESPSNGDHGYYDRFERGFPLIDASEATIAYLPALHRLIGKSAARGSRATRASRSRTQ